jgi:hypothetical protein
MAHTNHNREELKAAFEKVQNKEHWKNPIDAFIDPKEYGITDDAIAYFTGTQAFFNSNNLTLAQCEAGMVRVTADGYYLGPCN